MLKQILCWTALCMGALTPASAAVQCTFTAVPLQVSSEGLAEPVGDIILRCYNGTPNGILNGSFQVMLSTLVANNVDSDGQFVGITFSRELAGGGWTPLAASISPVGNSVAFQGFNTTFLADGTVGFRFGGIRAAASAMTKAAIQFTGSQQLMVSTTELLTVATASPGLVATVVATTISYPGRPLPEVLTLQNLITSGAPVATTRLTEAYAAAFQTVQAGMTSGTRFLLKFTDIPSGARLLLPEGIAGSNAFLPTLGSIGGPQAGTFDGSRHSLVLARVYGAAQDGSGGAPAFTISPTLQTPTLVRDADSIDAANAYAVYEVVDNDPSMLESAQIPMYFFVATDRFGNDTVVHQSVSLAPVSEKAGIVANGPIPRYLAVSPATDCQYWNDCANFPFPAMSINTGQTTTYAGDSGGLPKTGYVAIRNIGGGVLEWKTTVRYRFGTGWMKVTPDAGVDNYTVRYDLDPKSLGVGHYEADLIISQINSPSGSNAQYVVPIVFEVGVPTRPTLAAPVISDIISPVLRFGMEFAPASIAAAVGSNFDDRTTVTVGGLPARIVSVSANELTFMVPPTIGLGRQLVVANNQGKTSWPYGIEVVPVSPDIIVVFNGDSTLNTSSQPAQTGQILAVHSTGVRMAEKFFLKIHDRYVEASIGESPEEAILVLRAVVPFDLPTMQSEVQACATQYGSPDLKCSFGRTIWIQQTNP